MTRDLDALDRVQDALTGLAEALETGKPDEVLAAERPLAAAASELSSVGRAAVRDAVHLRARLLEARLSLDRCRAMGQASADLISTMFPAPSRSYGPGGTRPSPAVPPPSIAKRV